MTLTIRPAKASDLSAIHALDSDSFDEALSPLTIRQLLDLAGPLALIAEESGPTGSEMVGYLLAARAFDTQVAWALSLAVKRSARRHGVGQRLVEELFRILEEHGFSRVLLTTKPENVALQKLAENMGGKISRVEQDYFGPGESRIIIEKTL